MPVLLEKAPGKIILFGEHAVVYGQPAIALPVTRVNATARIFPILGSNAGGIQILAPDVGVDSALSDLPEDHPLAKAIRLTLDSLHQTNPPPFSIQISSSIPVSAGMGSGAAISIAIIRAVSSFLGYTLAPEQISDLAYQVEKIYHGTPSGIDNNVITFQKPVYFVREKPLEFLEINQTTCWVIADSGEKTPTKDTVAAVRQLHTEDPDYYNKVFTDIGAITQQAHAALTEGDLPTLGNLMNENQRLLETLTVSSPKLDILIQAAREAGAVGAKLSGGGRGGLMIALAEQADLKAVKQGLMDAGAIMVITSLLTKSRAV
jgi:mevalonate kinase